MRHFSLTQRVYYEDTDAGGVVFYANYLKFLERARTEWLRTLGYDQSQLAVMFVVHRVEITYQQPARLDDLLQVSVELMQAQAARLIFKQQVICAGQVLCEARVEVVCVQRESLKPCRLPETLRQALK